MVTTHQMGATASERTAAGGTRVGRGIWTVVPHFVRGSSRTSSLQAAPRSPHPAFALVEVIVASLILAIAVSVMIGLAARSVSMQSEGERIDTAARLADERLNLVLALGPEKYLSVFPRSGPCDEPFSDYAYELTIEPQGPGRAYLVRADVSWPAGTRRRSVSLETLIAPRLGEDPDPDRKPRETLTR